MRKLAWTPAKVFIWPERLIAGRRLLQATPPPREPVAWCSAQASRWCPTAAARARRARSPPQQTAWSHTHTHTTRSIQRCGDVSMHRTQVATLRSNMPKAQQRIDCAPPACSAGCGQSLGDQCQRCPERPGQASTRPNSRDAPLRGEHLPPPPRGRILGSSTAAIHSPNLAMLLVPKSVCPQFGPFLLPSQPAWACGLGPRQLRHRSRGVNAICLVEDLLHVTRPQLCPINGL